MQLSVLIPTYNHACHDLVQSLWEQCDNCAGLQQYEIIVADDGSTDEASLSVNRRINALSHCHLVETGRNVGRSRIRRTMVRQMRYPLVLIMDSDAAVVNDHFIENYLKHATRAQVICGGATVSAQYARKDNTLRFRNEMAIYRKHTAHYRNRHTYESFTPFNVMIHKDVFLQVNFDETLSQYGYEDVLFGQALQEKGISILHIDNPLIHTGMDSNADYLEKTETALRNLHMLQGRLSGYSPILQAYQRIRKFRCAHLLRLFHNTFGPSMRKNLMGQHPSLLLFKMYKLGYFACLG